MVKESNLADCLSSCCAGLINNVVSLPRVSPDGGSGSVILAEMGTNVLVSRRCHRRCCSSCLV